MGHDFLLMEVLREDWLENGPDRLSTRWNYLRERGGVCVADPSDAPEALFEGSHPPPFPRSARQGQA